MRIIALRNLKVFWKTHPDAKPSLERWVKAILDADWQTPSQVQAAFVKAKVLNGDRVRFEISGGNYRLISIAGSPSSNFSGRTPNTAGSML